MSPPAIGGRPENIFSQRQCGAPCGRRTVTGLTDEQTGAPAFGYPAKDQRELAAECRRLKSMLVSDKRPLPEISSCAALREGCLLSLVAASNNYGSPWLKQLSVRGCRTPARYSRGN